MIRSRQGWGDSTRISSRLVDRITIESQVETSDGQGGVTRGWETLAECFAEVVPLYTDASEKIDARKSVTRMQYRVAMRSREDVTAQMRVNWNGRLLNIQAVIPLETHLELLVQEGVAI